MLAWTRWQRKHASKQAIQTCGVNVWSLPAIAAGMKQPGRGLNQVATRVFYSSPVRFFHAHSCSCTNNSTHTYPHSRQLAQQRASKLEGEQKHGNCGSGWQQGPGVACPYSYAPRVGQLWRAHLLQLCAVASQTAPPVSCLLSTFTTLLVTLGHLAADG